MAARSSCETMIWTAPGASRSSSAPCSRTCGGSASNGAKAPISGGPFGPYNQSERLSAYRAALETLRVGGFIYPCYCSRRDIQSAPRAPHAADDDEPIYPGACQNKTAIDASKYSWRFRVPDGEAVTFVDNGLGRQTFIAGQHFGDFVVWRNDDVPAYQLACVVDDAAMQITEVVRGADLLLSTARQLLLYRALGLRSPEFFHCPLMLDENGQRLAKRSESLSLRTLRENGAKPEELRKEWPSI
ncbi:MAG TPA: glutamate--tRNA ligase family protein [Candidatus Sulfotelmatobacter sp.]|nr:glutamate--tRNA ligase family protein [Candidatus Sulfotelmatobacter sp.]